MKYYIKKPKTKTTTKNNNKKPWRLFFYKINNIDTPLTRLTRGNRDSIQINRNRNEKGDRTIEIEEIK